jgi:thymidine kinase
MQLNNTINFAFGKTTGSKTNSSAVSKEEASTQIQKLANDANSWSNGSLIKSNQERNLILQSVYQFYLAGKNEESIKSAVDDFASSQNIVFKSGSGLSTKLIRVIFQFDHKKSSSYAATFRVAESKQVQGSQFAKFVEETGGLEAVRKLGQKQHSVVIDKEARATDYLISMDGVDVAIPGLDTQFTSTDGQKFFLLILTRKENDLASIKAAFTDKIALGSVLKKFYDVNKSEIDKAGSKSTGDERINAIHEAANSVIETA